MELIAKQVILEAVRALAPVLRKIQKRDRELHEQMRSALSSAVLNLAEGAALRDGNRRLRYGTAAGSAKEARDGLELAVAYEYVAPGEIATGDALLDRFGALTWRLRYPKR